MKCAAELVPLKNATRADGYVSSFLPACATEEFRPGDLNHAPAIGAVRMERHC